MFVRVQKVLKEVDIFARDLHDELEARNLSNIVDIVFVSDHGMTDTSHPELIFIDDILGEGWHHIEHEDGTQLLLTSTNRTSLICLSIQAGLRWASALILKRTPRSISMSF